MDKRGARRICLAPLGICGIMDRENDPGGLHHAGKPQPKTANRRL